MVLLGTKVLLVYKGYFFFFLFFWFFFYGLWIMGLGGGDFKANAVVDVRISLWCV